MAVPFLSKETARVEGKEINAVCQDDIHVCGTVNLRGGIVEII